MDTHPHELPKESEFLLEVDMDRLCNGDFEQQTYWVYAMKAARNAGRRQARRGGRARRAFERRRLRPRRVRLGVDDVERQLRTEQYSRASDEIRVRDALLFDSPSRRRPSPAQQLQKFSRGQIRG